MEPVLNIIQSIFSNSPYLVPTIWVTLGCAVAWFLLSAKTNQEITEEEAEMLWKTHKQFKHCSAETFIEINKGKKLIGYICQCGHEHKQERPIINFGR
ncbi:MAG: hypothetical protein GH151_02420 [Bacteroidetes bacterium]|nr:hypothetical protein [Bacteroidota bacterium]